MLTIIKKLFSLLNQKQKKQSFFFLVLLFFSTIFEGLSVALVFPLIKIVIDKSFLMDIDSKINFIELSNLSYETVVFYCLILIVAAYLIKSIYLIFFSWWKSNFILRINNEISGRLFKKYVYSSYAYFFNKNSSEFIRNIYSESRYINQSIDALFKFFIEAFSIIIILIILLIIEFKNTILMLIIFIGFLLLFNFISSKKIRDWGFKKQHFVGKVFQSMQQTFGLIKEIILRGNQKFFSNNFDYVLNNLNEQTKKLMFLSEIPKNLLETITVLMISSLIFFYSFNNVGIIDLVPIVGLFGAAALRIVPGFNRIIACKQNLDSCYPSVKLVHEELKEIDTSLTNDKEKMSLSNDNFSFEKELELKNINYKYPKAKETVINNLNFKIKKNECICIIGNSGSGKSTLVDIISGLLEPTLGNIFLDGKQVSLNNSKWRNLIGYVTQSVYLADDSIKNNILFGLNQSNKFDEKKFNLAIKYSQLDEFIKQLPEGVDFKVGENGIKLSGGQKQRIGIARTLYSNPKILVLDEITSSLDSNTSASLLKSLNNLTGKITIIYISHNNQVINNANTVYEIIKDEKNLTQLTKIKINEKKEN
tara:strand:- start:6915 stop:8690 length:1776 start_codon:yes stop_codon:yes gene_type:complete